MNKKVTALPSNDPVLPPDYKIYHRYSPRPRYAPHEMGDIKTVQSAIAECDINNVARRLLSGMDPGVPVKTGVFRDNTSITDMKSNLDIIRSHESAFNDLPPGVRARYSSVSEFYDAQYKALEKSAGNSNSLDVTVPTDSEAVRTQKGVKREASSDESDSGEKEIQKRDQNASKK